jgi:hypothetical protein
MAKNVLVYRTKYWITTILTEIEKITKLMDSFITS